VSGAGSLWALLLAVVVSPLGAWAQTDVLPPPVTPELRRELDGHEFTPSKFSLDPFVSTYVSSETGFGYGSAPGRTYNLCNGAVCPGPGSFASFQVGAFAQLLDYQYGFLDWWAVRVGTKILVYSGINDTGVVGVGTNANVNVSAGTTMSWKVGDRVRLGGSFDFSIGPAFFFNILQGVVNSIQQGQVVSPINSFNQYSLNPAFVGAWTVTRSLGMTFSGSYTFTHGSDSVLGASAHLLGSNILFNWDMNELGWVPIGLLGGFATSFTVSDTRFLEFRYQFGIMYTGVRALDVGLEILYNRAPVIGNTNIFLSSLIGLIVIQYNFN
jgi:hypothetical protein